MRLLDTNVVLRWLLDDDKEKSAAFARLLRHAASAGTKTLSMPDIAVAELVWVLESFYEVPRPRIAELVRKLLATDSILFDRHARLFEAITLYEEHNVDYLDAYLAATAREEGLEAVLSYDRDFDKIPGVKRIEPT